MLEVTLIEILYPCYEISNLSKESLRVKNAHNSYFYTHKCSNTHTHTHRERERERNVGIICVIIYDDLALEAWTQREERQRQREREQWYTKVPLA